MSKFSSFAAILALTACSAQSGVPSIPPASQNAGPGGAATFARQRIAPQFVYVTDRVQDALLVYAAGKDAPPIAKVQFTTEPDSVAVDRDGNVYVALWNSTIAVFAPGARQRLTTISKDIDEPSGMAFDDENNLYVANRDPKRNDSYVVELARGTYAAINRVAAPPKFYIGGIAVTGGAIYASIQNGPGGYLVQLYPQQKNVAVMCGLGGVAAEPDGELAEGACGVLEVLAPPLWKPVLRRYWVRSPSIRLLTAADDGTLVIPFDGWSGGPEYPSSVLIVPRSGASQYRITQGLQAPTGAAEGL